MAGNFSAWRFSRTTLAILLATACSAQLALGQYTWVTDTDSVGDWSDLSLWDTDNNSGTPNLSYPNGIGVTAQINQPIKSGVGGYTLDMPTTDVTVGTLTIDNTGDDYATRITMVNHAPGRLIFEDSSGTAKWIETPNTPDAPQNVQNSIQVLIQLNSDLEITHDNYPNLNSGTIFTNRIDGDSSRTIIKKGIGGIQFNLNVAPPLAPGQGFYGQILIQEGAIRLINKTTFLSTVGGITVSDGGQLQLADNATAVPDYNMASGAVLNLNGDGNNGPTSGPEGALRFGILTAHTNTFHNPVVLQSDSVISVGAAGAIGILEQAVSGTGSLTKHGGGKLILSNASNSYAGDTRVLAGGPLVTKSNFLSDSRDVYLVTGSVLDLDFNATDTIRRLYIDGVAQAIGTWGPTGGNTSALITSTAGGGLLNVTSFPVPGDYNDNGSVDAADYILYRKGVTPLPANEIDNIGTTNDQDWVEWKGKFGNPAPGAGGETLNAQSVPEPTTVVLFALFAPFLVARKTRRIES